MTRALSDALDALLVILAGLAPGAIGSLVAVIYEWDPGLTWRMRLAQWGAGICVSYYVGIGLMLAFDLGGFGAESVKFLVGMIAFKAAPRFLARASDVIADLPSDLRDRLLPRKDRP